MKTGTLATRHLLIALIVLGTPLLPVWPAPAADSELQSAARDQYERQVRPLLARRCYQCHSTKSSKRKGDLTLDSRDGLLRGGSRGELFVAGRPEASLLVQAVGYQDESLQMPPSGKLPADEIAVLTRWIATGGYVPEEVPAASDGDSPGDLEQARRFWSFQQPLRSSPPAVETPAWLKRPLDAFVLSELEKRELTASVEADRRTLIRRVTFNLIGLPPAAEEVAAFVADSRPDAYERLVDRLLASPHYGERWARFWLDLVRYADTTDTWLTSTQHAWRYRDWTVNAINEDVPYDRFVKLQMAADLMDDARIEDLAALGLLGLSPTYWKELRLAPSLILKVVADEWDERIDVVSRTFLGLSVTCARCHDHKYDPISMRDYYALAGVFASCQLAELPLEPGADAAALRQARQKVTELEAEIAKLKKSDPDKAAALEQQVETIRRETPHFDAAMVHAVEDASIEVLADGPDATKIEVHPGIARDVPLFQRGSPDSLGPPVSRRFLAVLSASDSQPFHEGSGRRELAEAIFREGRPLVSRVIVNRIWREHFGQGLVTTPSDFGRQGERPSHPQLLDDLAARFAAGGWSLKWLHRQIVLSAAYRQSTASNAANVKVDPENRWLWRMNRRRLDVESWRDAMLAAGGNLDLHTGGPPLDINDAANRRRTLYGSVGRRELDDMLRLFDFPQPEFHSPKRELTTTPLQQLFVLNGPLIQRQAEAVAQRIGIDDPDVTSAELVERCYLLLFARKPTDHERQLACEFLSSASGESLAQRWQQLVHVFLGLNEFMFVD